MDCPSCADDIKRSLGKLEGIDDVRVDVVGGRVRVTYADGKLARGDIARAIRSVGYRVEDGEAHRAAFTVEGMDCADEVRQLEGALAHLPGVTNVSFDLVRRRMVVEGALTAAEIQRAVKATGMAARLEGEERRPLTFWERRGRLVVAIVSGVLLAAGVALNWLGVGDAATVPLLALSVIVGGWFIAPRGWRAARSGALDMNFLMTIAAIGAAVIGEWAEGASAMFLFAVAQLLEAYSMDRARNAIKALMDLSPTEASVMRDGGEQSVPVAEVEVGETIVVRPGQRIPLDGEVTGGRSAVNQAPITGESVSVDKEPGAEVFAGSINEQGVLEIRVTKLVEDTTLARIIHSVEEAQASRAPSQSFVDRFSRIYTPAVVALAVLVFLLPPLFGLGGWDIWFYRALAMLVIACPCALVISTPVSIVSGLAAAARGGVLVKGGAHLKHAGAVTTVAFDKTGTLTEGRPSVTDVVAHHAELLPDDKVRIVRALEASGERVAFVGDGVNDAPALAAATVGIAMGAACTDVALETADIALMADDLSRLPFAIGLSRSTLRIIKQNIWFSIAIKGVFLVLALVGWATLWMAVASDMGASLAVVVNGLRALHLKK
jgi:Cd2+/Zn2+-exporting ATPase